MNEKGPYRERAELENKKQQLLKMEEEIVELGKFSIPLPEDLGERNELMQHHYPNLDFPIFLDLLGTKFDIKNPKKKIGPQDISLYSLETGILKYDGEVKFSGAGGRIEYFYKNESDPKVSLEISVQKGKATLTTVTTKEDAEIKKRQTEKENWKYTIDVLEYQIAALTKTIKTGVSPELQTDYSTRLSDLKTSLERLLFDITGELEKGQEK